MAVSTRLHSHGSTVVAAAAAAAAVATATVAAEFPDPFTAGRISPSIVNHSAHPAFRPPSARDSAPGSVSTPGTSGRTAYFADQTQQRAGQYRKGSVDDSSSRGRDLSGSASPSVPENFMLTQGLRGFSLLQLPRPASYIGSQDALSLGKHNTSLHIDQRSALTPENLCPPSSSAASSSPSPFFSSFNTPSTSSGDSSARPVHTWHSPSAHSTAVPSGNTTQSLESSSSGEAAALREATTSVVLLGWLGARQKHLRKYAEWYNEQGMEALTFVLPMGDLLSLNPGDKAERHVDVLVAELEAWLEADAGGESVSGREGADNASERSFVFHTFSNTGWLAYGAVLKRLRERHGSGIEKRIKGCVVDSAPHMEPDPQVWASGFSTAILKRRSKAAIAMTVSAEAAKAGAADIGASAFQPKQQPDVVEKALQALLEKFFSVYLKLPAVQRKLEDLTEILAREQPPCPQLYIYSTADRVIPAESVEAFIRLQKSDGRRVVARRLDSSPHVDHFRTFPQLYTEQLTSFLRECLPPRHIATS